LKPAALEVLDPIVTVCRKIPLTYARSTKPLQVRKSLLLRTLGLLIDTSQSVRERFTFEQQAAIAFLTQTLRKNYDHAFVMGFDITAKVTQDFTDDIEKLAAGIHLLRPSTSITAMYDAVNSACDKLLKRPQTGPVRRLIVLV